MSSQLPHQDAVYHTLSYFGQFTYAPTLREIHRFLPISSPIGGVEPIVRSGVKSGKIIEFTFPSNVSRYTLPQYSITQNDVLNRLQTAEIKEKSLAKWISILRHMPGIRLIGLSGSVASYNAHPSDDIDLFIITAHDRLWTVRAVVTVFFILFRKKRSRNAITAPNQICLNLWFTESALQVPKSRQTEYSAYEVWRMRPLCAKHGTYDRFLSANRWTTNYLPNIPIPASNTIPTASKLAFLIDPWEQIARFIQKKLIDRHKTTEYITENQLWFFPDDIQMHISKNKQKRPIERGSRKKARF